MKLKRCTKCKKEKSFTEFQWNRRLPNRTNRFRKAQCRKCCYRITQDCGRVLKKEVIAAYGGMCWCCGEIEIKFLTFDHGSRGTGLAHRRSLTKSKLVTDAGTVYRDLKKNGFPKIKGYRILCANCHQATAHGQQCPHMRKR